MKKITLMFFALVAFSWQSNAQLNEGFDVAGLPAGWSETIISGADNDWAFGATQNQNNTVSPRTGAGMAYYYEGSYNGEVNRLETPSQDLTSFTTPILTFYYTQLDWGGDQDELSIWYKDSAAGTWTMISEYTSSVASWTEVNIVLPNPSADYYIGFQGYSGYGRGITIDDVSISEAPSCLAPGDLSVFATSPTEADLNWTATGSETDFTYEYGATGFTQGTGTTGMVTGTSASITGLTAGTDYDFYVQANCGVDGDSAFSGPFTWTQPDEGESCGTAYVATIEADCGTATPITLDFTGAPSNISTSCDTFNNYGLWVTTTTDATGGLRVNASAAVDMAVYDACGGVDVECFDGGIAPNVDLMLTPNTTYYMYFWQEGTGSTAMVDVCLSLPPSCLEPTGLAANPTSLTDVDITWTAGGSETDWTYEYGVSPYAQGGGGTSGTVMTTPSLSLMGLTAGETYDIYIQANCGAPEGDSPYVTIQWTQPNVGDTCDAPIVVGALPYNTSDDTANYGDDYSGGPGTDCGTTNGYLNGDDVVYSYTATSDTSINVALSALGDTYAGVFAYNDCADIGTMCATAGALNGFSTDDINFDMSVTNGNTYYIVISTWASPQSTAYTLDITENTCTNATVAYSVVNDCAVSGGFNIEVDITDMGSATNLTVSDDQGSPTQPATGITTLTFGPYVNGTDVIITVVDDSDGTCTQSSAALTQIACPPANDDCANAEALTVNADLACGVTTSGTIAGATASGEDESACSGTEDDDVWYSFVATATSHTIDLLNVANGTTDLYHSVWEGTCGGLTLVAGSCSDPNSSTVSGLTIGNTYLLRVYSWTSTPGQTSTFDVCIGTLPPPPANDNCANAITLTPGGIFEDNPVVGTNASATDSGEMPLPGCATYDPADASGNGGDVWYAVTVPADGNLTIQTNANPTGSGGDSGMAVYSGSCGALVLVECDDDDSPDGAYSQVVIEPADGLANQVVYARVWEFGGNAILDFQISAYSATLGIDDVDNASAFTYYPNPVQNTLTLNAQNSIERVTMYNILGQEVLKATPNNVDSELDMSSLQTGTYFVRVTIGNNTETIRVIKQ